MRKIIFMFIFAFLLVNCKGTNNGTNNNSQPALSIKTLITQGARVVDVRTVEEFNSGHYEGAVNIPLHTVEERISEFGEDKTKPIIVYCRSGNRSSQAKTILESKGYTNIINGGGLSDMPN